MYAICQSNILHPEHEHTWEEVQSTFCVLCCASWNHKKKALVKHLDPTYWDPQHAFCNGTSAVSETFHRHHGTSQVNLQSKIPIGITELQRRLQVVENGGAANLANENDKIWTLCPDVAGQYAANIHYTAKQTAKMAKSTRKLSIGPSPIVQTLWSAGSRPATVPPGRRTCQDIGAGPTTEAPDSRWPA